MLTTFTKNTQKRMEDKEIIYHPLKEKLISIEIPEWDWSFNLDDILTIDYSNIFGEIITIPVLENRIGRITNELREVKKQEKLRLEVKEAELRTMLRKKIASEGGKKASLQEEADFLSTDPLIKNLRFKIIKIEKDLDNQETMYDAVKSKAFKLNNLSKNITPEEFERDLVDCQINNILVRVRDRKYKK